MSSKPKQIRVLGQRSIPSSFIFRSSNDGNGSKEDVQKKNSDKISLSDFLNQKLHKNVVPTKSVKGKSVPFWSPMASRDDCRDTDQVTLNEKEEESNPVLEELVFEQFKHSGLEEGDGMGSCGDGSEGNSGHSFGSGAEGNSSQSLGSINSRHVDEVGSSNLTDLRGTRKRVDPFQGSSNLTDLQGTRERVDPFQEFQGGDGKDSIQKHLLVLGVDLDRKRKERKETSSINKKPRRLYNHYANGCGWWDCDREGVDTEEVGLGEIWEGVGSTTFGGIDWH